MFFRILGKVGRSATRWGAMSHLEQRHVTSDNPLQLTRAPWSLGFRAGPMGFSLFLQNVVLVSAFDRTMREECGNLSRRLRGNEGGHRPFFHPCAMRR